MRSDKNAARDAVAEKAATQRLEVMRMIAVLDQNVMRSDDLRTLLRSPDGWQFVVPDVALEEMTKHVRWEETMRASFRILGPELGRVHFSAGIGELLRYERKYGRPVGSTQLLPPDLTNNARAMVQAVLQGGEQLDAFRNSVDEMREAANERQDGQYAKERLMRNVDGLKHAIGETLVSDGRNGNMSRAARLGMLKSASEVHLRRFFSDFVPADSRYPVSSFMTTRLVQGRLWYADRWLSESGLEAAMPGKIVNDDLDMEYALTAAFFDDFISQDRRAANCAADLKRMSHPVEGPVLLEAYANHLGVKATVPR